MKDGNPRYFIGVRKGQSKEKYKFGQSHPQTKNVGLQGNDFVYCS